MPLVELKRYEDRIAAEIARGRLAAEGIEAVLFDAGLSSLGVGGALPARLMVAEEDRPRAAAILAAADG
ncbi:MAG: DUF2007 domain-containing protein [Sphingomonadaceae bacterium]